MEWLGTFSKTTLIAEMPAGARGWNCKPHVLLPVLSLGYETVFWLDADIIVTRTSTAVLFGRREQEIIVAQEPRSLPHQGTGPRTRGWGLPVGREFAATLNSAVLGVGPSHRPLLEKWRELLTSPLYKETQMLPLEERPLHLKSDQDVLNALVGTVEFSSWPIRILQSGREIIHAGGALGFSLAERLRYLLHPLPAFLHGTAGKPWHLLGSNPYWSEKRGYFWWYRRLLQETSPYVAESRRYERELGEAAPWMHYYTPLGLLLRALGLNHHALRGMPLAAAATIIERVRKFSRGRKLQV
jgi:hypothetical protein